MKELASPHPAKSSKVAKAVVKEAQSNPQPQTRPKLLQGRKNIKRHSYPKDSTPEKTLPTVHESQSIQNHAIAQHQKEPSVQENTTTQKTREPSTRSMKQSNSYFKGTASSAKKVSSFNYMQSKKTSNSDTIPAACVKLVCFCLYQHIYFKKPKKFEITKS